MLAFFLAMLAVHWLDRFVPLYFIVIAGAAGIMLLNLLTAIPGCRFLATLEIPDRLAIWIVLVALTVIAYLHNANLWASDGFLHRPQDVSLWKTGLILAVSLAAPLAH